MLCSVATEVQNIHLCLVVVLFSVKTVSIVCGQDVFPFGLFSQAGEVNDYHA
jgi:hypothetical protein